ncbi:MAG: 50S ribosomal protein L25, partial [Patescibacteria group bacterium]
RIEAKTREIRGRKTVALRAEGQVPAVMYGFETEPKNIVLDRNAFTKVYGQAGESTVVDLEIEGTKHPVLISEIQRDPLTDFITHADFRRVDPKRKIEAKIPLKLVGMAPAVKELGGTLLQTLEEVEVMSLPDALVHEIEVDVTKLATFEDVIRVKDISIPDGIEIKSDLEQAVASVQPPRSEEELAALDAAVDGDISKVEVLTEKKPDEVAAEGADAAAAPEKKEAKK